jgi:hypothetical protein
LSSPSSGSPIRSLPVGMRSKRSLRTAADRDPLRKRGQRCAPSAFKQTHSVPPHLAWAYLRAGLTEEGARTADFDLRRAATGC